MIIVTTENIPGKEIKEVFGFVSASTVRTKNIGKDIGAGFKTLVGGEIKAYQEMMEESRKIAIGRMVENPQIRYRWFRCRSHLRTQSLFFSYGSLSG